MAEFNFEESRKTWGRYPKAYLGPKNIFEQIAMIGDIFGLNTAQAAKFASNLPIMPAGAEGCFAIAKISALARKHFPDLSDPRDQYCAAVRLGLKELAARCDFVNTLRGEILVEELHREPPSLFSITSEKLRQTDLSLQAMEILEKEQPGDILIIPGQFGLRYQDCSVNNALWAMFDKGNEFSPGVFAGICMNLCHLDRYDFNDDLVAELDPVYAGDEVSRNADGIFSEVPSFFVFQGAPGQKNRLVLGADSPASHALVFGAVSFFLPLGLKTAR
ncbi:MAG: hypothetical protein WC719_02900 [Patescibacteria group bacterium]|jgi:hypothetical protein